MAPWIRIALNILTGTLVHQGKVKQAEVLNDALKAIDAGRDVDDAMNAYAEEWAANGEPSIESITQTRKEIQAAIG